MTENETNEQVIESAQDHLDTGEENVTDMNEDFSSAENNGDVQNDSNSKLQAEVDELKDRYLRLNAEFDNYKKRNLKERIEFSKVANTELMEAVLPVLDDFERAIKALEKNKDKHAADGIVLIQNKMKNILAQKGLQPIKSIGEVFDVEHHEAITSIPVDDEKKKGKVIDEVECGYLLNGKILRHAKVVVGS